MVLNMTEEKMTKIIDAITEIGIDEDKAVEILGVFIEELEKGGFDTDYENIKNEKEQIKLENEKLVEKIKKIAVEGVMRSKNCRTVKALSALVDMDNVNVDDEGNISGHVIVTIMEWYHDRLEEEQ